MSLNEGQHVPPYDASVSFAVTQKEVILFDWSEAMKRQPLLCCFLISFLAALVQTISLQASAIQYRLLATKKTSTMEKEVNAAASKGFRFEGVMGGETALGGAETVVLMSSKDHQAYPAGFEYRLLATNKTSTMQKELQAAAVLGYEYRGQTVFETAFGGKEVVLILERDRASTAGRHDYRLLATSKTSTMQEELAEAGEAGFEFVGLTLGETAFGGRELVAVLRRLAKE
jgi:hypothetical protein